MATVTALRKPKVEKKATVGGLIDQMSAVRDQRRTIAEQDKALSAELETLQTQLLELMDAEGCKKATGSVASASIGESTQFNTVDWEVFMAYLIKTKQGHLVQRRVSAPAVTELFASKGGVPGLEPFTKRTINLRNL